MTVWIILGWDGDSNRYGPAVFDYPVTRKEAKKVLREYYPDREIVFGIWKEEVNTKE
jgi:deoxyribodipyrimidine photolyase-like uncharacterized protein